MLLACAAAAAAAEWPAGDPFAARWQRPLNADDARTVWTRIGPPRVARPKTASRPSYTDRLFAATRLPTADPVQGGLRADQQVVTHDGGRGVDVAVQSVGRQLFR